MRNSTPPKNADSRKSRLEETARQSKRDRTKLIVMCVGLVLVVAAYLASSLQEKKHRQADSRQIEEAPFIETVAVKAFEAPEVFKQILDNRPEDRVLLPTTVLDPFVEHIDGFNDAHFHALDRQLLDKDNRAAIQTEPSAFRGKAFRARGRLEEVKSRERLDGKTEYKGWLRAETGEVTHFVVLKMPDEVTLNGFMRFDGLFVKLYNAEGHEGERVEGPLLVGASMVDSYPQTNIANLTSDVMQDTLSRVNDDTAKNSTGLDGAVYLAQWVLLDYMNSEAYAQINWEEDSVELTNEVMTSILKNGDDWRFRLASDGVEDPRAEPSPEDGSRPLLQEDLIPIPIRFPVCKNMGTNSLDPGENPARLDSITNGWLGNWTWTNQAGVIKFVMPGFREDLHDFKGNAKLVQGKGFFLKNHNYESLDHGTRTAPFFVLTELEVFNPVEDKLAQNLMWGVLGLTLILVALFPFLLMRDRKKSDELQRNLVRRKQERRRRLAAEQTQA